MSMLDELAEKRDQILLAEIGALIHDLGKLSREFISAKASNGHGDDIHHLFLKRHPPQIPDALKGHSTDQNRVETALRYLESIDIPQAVAMRSHLRAEYQANPQLYLEGALQTYVDKNPQATDLAAQVQAVVGEHKKLSHPRFGELTLAERTAQVPSDFLPDDLVSLLNTVALLPIQSDAGPLLLSETVIGDIIEGHHSPPAPWRIGQSEYLSMLRARDGVDGLDSGIDKGDADQYGIKQHLGDTRIATAFGHEPDSLHIKTDELKQVRYDDYANNLALILQHIQTERVSLAADHTLPSEFWQEILYEGWRTEDGYSVKGLRKLTERAFRQALGETRRAANDVTLWDHSYSVASLYKAALAKVLLEGEWTEPAVIKWRILRISFDGLGFWGQAHHVTDLLGRQKAVGEALDSMRQKLEIAHTLGNEIYRDENGSAFLMPDLGNAHREFKKAVRDIVSKAMASTDLAGELVPHCHWHSEPVREEMAQAFGTTLREAPRPLAANAKQIDDWWKELPHREICTVCGVRPMGYPREGSPQEKELNLEPWADQEKAEKRNICRVCLDRRGRRAENWLKKEADRTIWADEVVDVNGRFALIVGRFDLDRWLDGTLVRTMLKNPSPARVRRVWETTQGFWEAVQRTEIPNLFEKRRPRLAITPRHTDKLAHPDPKKGLGPYHTYELQIGGSSIGVVWDPGGEELIFTEYLCDLGRRLGLPEKAWRDEANVVEALQAWLIQRAEKDGPWPLLEPSGYLSPATETGYGVEMDPVYSDIEEYVPHIPLLTEPALFMALVPADKAMEVTRAIKEKYEREMSKVRDRLPLHLGVVIAPRRTPLRAVLEAGRAMLERRGTNWEEWEVAKDPETKKADQAPAHLVEGNQHFASWWDVPLEKNERAMRLCIGAVMGDGETDDQWYAHLLTREPKPKSEDFADQPWGHPTELEQGDEVCIAPSTFDFEFLDTTARRFEIAYDEHGRRRGHRTRPYLLDEVEVLQAVWKLISRRLTTSQWMALDGLIERKRREWDEPWGVSEEYSPAFERLVHDALCNAEWRRKVDGAVKKGWDKLEETEQGLLKRAALQGVLSDAINLYHEAMKMKGKREEA